VDLPLLRHRSPRVLGHRSSLTDGPVSGVHYREPVFDSIIVVTDRTVLDKQIRDNIKQFAQVSAVVGAVTQGSGQLRGFIEQGKKIIISTIQKFPFIVEEIGDQHRERRFAIIIDEAHSSQGGRTTSAMHAALGQDGGDEDETEEDRINRVMESRKKLKNASYFAFTATPKNKTLEIFGVPQPDGTFRPFHTYTMKQAIEEKFILDVLQNYTPVSSYYRLMKKVEEDPEFDVKKAQRKLRKYVESHDHAIRQKAEIMVDHFHDQVISKQKIGGKARAMVVSSGIERAMQYKRAFDAYLVERKSPYRAIVAFSGEHEVDGQKVTEASMNGYVSASTSASWDSASASGKFGSVAVLTEDALLKTESRVTWSQLHTLGLFRETFSPTLSAAVNLRLANLAKICLSAQSIRNE